ncbi:MAG: hypothetical protein ACXAAT_14265, partial [Candidatus Hodarchaeales archaeon]
MLSISSLISKKGLWYKKVIFLGFLLIFLTGFGFPVYAVDYDVEENFNVPDITDSNLDNWTFKGTDWQSSEILAINHTFTISDGELVSGGISSSYNLNGASISDNTSVGGWSMDVFV